MMILANELDREKKIDKKLFERFVLVLAPFAPHLTEEIWHELGNKSSIHSELWPEADLTKLSLGVVKIGVQVNGKIRAELEIPIGTDENTAKTKALALPGVEKWVAGQEIKKTIFVKDRLIGFVV
jgi:leucyl-tRNA synthetase